MSNTAQNINLGKGPACSSPTEGPWSLVANIGAVHTGATAGSLPDDVGCDAHVTHAQVFASAPVLEV